jgi:hypothetical protein
MSSASTASIGVLVYSACSASSLARRPDCAGQHAVGDAVQRPELHDVAFGRERRRNPAGAADHARRAECRDQPVDVGEPVEEREHVRRRTHRGADRRDRGIEVVGLAGEQHEVVLGPQVGLPHELRGHGEVAVRVSTSPRGEPRAPIAHESDRATCAGRPAK